MSCNNFSGITKEYCQSQVLECANGNLNFVDADGQQHNTSSTAECVDQVIINTALHGVPEGWKSETQEKVDQPDLELVEARPASPGQCEEKYLEKDSGWSISEYKKCLAENSPEIAELFAQDEIWGKFGLVIKGGYRNNDATFNDMYRQWNKDKPEYATYKEEACSDEDMSGYVDTTECHSSYNYKKLRTFKSNDAHQKWQRSYFDIALTTDPGYAIVSKSLLLQATAVGFQISSGDDIAPDRFGLRLLDFTLSYPIAARNLLDFGFAAIQPDVNLMEHLGAVFKLGLTWQMQGTAVGDPKHHLNITDMVSFFQSHTMLGFDVQGSFAAFPLPGYGGESKSLAEERYDPDETYDDPRRRYFFDQGDIDAKIFDHTYSPSYICNRGASKCSNSEQELEDRYGGSIDPKNYVTDFSHAKTVHRSRYFGNTKDAANFIYKVRAKLSGVQGGETFSTNYLAFAEDYPQFKLLNVGAELYLNYHAGLAIDFFLNGDVNKLMPTAKDDHIEVPDKGFGYKALFGGKLRLLNFF